MITALLFNTCLCVCPQYQKEVELTTAESLRLSGIKNGLRRGTLYRDTYVGLSTLLTFDPSDFKKAQDARDMQSLSLKDIQERYMYRLTLSIIFYYCAGLFNCSKRLLQ